MNNRPKPQSSAAAVIRSLNSSELLALGTGDLAYVKPVVVNGTHAYAICAADGEQLALVHNRAIAMATARDNDLDPVSVH